MSQTRSLLSDGAWLTGLQGLAALGQLVGIRVLTEILPPAVFGEFSLWFGVVLLMAVGIANPTIQAMLRYYPEFALQGKGAIVRLVVRQQLTKIVTWLIPVFLIATVTVLVSGWANITTLTLLITLVVVEVVRMKNTALLNAVRAHRAYGIWAVIESWGRPMVAWVLVAYLGASITWVLAGFLLASLCAWALMQQFVPDDKTVVATISEQAVITSKFWQYTLPLLPLGLIGWTSGMADRYIIGALMSPAEVGLYVAIYSLASRPMLMFGGIVESAIRPVYQNALIEGDQRCAHYYLRKWVLLIVFGSCVATVIAWFGHQWFANILLGEQYRSVSYLFPWIVGGYAFYLFYHIVGRVCYAYDATLNILMIEGAGAALAIFFGFICIKQAGLWGAAFAIPLYFGAQLIFALVLVKKLLLTEKTELL